MPSENRETRLRQKAVLETKLQKRQALLAQQIESRHCPSLRFHESDKVKKTIETMKIIDEAVKEIKHEPPDNDKGKESQ